jgi:hypothetical protein
MTRTQRHALRFLITSFCLFGFGGIGISATEVGGSGGYGTGSYSYSLSSCVTTTTTSRQSTSQHYGAFVQTDLPNDEFSVGVEGGLTIAGERFRSVTTKTEDDPVTGEPIITTTDTDTGFVADYRVYVIPRVGVHTQFIDLVGGIGFSGGVSAESPMERLPAMTYEIRLGRLGIVAYYGRGEWFNLFPNDLVLVHGVSLGGGDHPEVHVGMRLGLHRHLAVAAPISMAEVGVVAPRHWPVRFAISGAVGRYSSSDDLSWDVQGELSLVFGKRRKLSERASLRRLDEEVVEF